MKTLPTAVVLILLSVLLVLANQIYLGSVLPTVLYTLLTTLLIFLNVRREKTARKNLIARLNDLFDGGEPDPTAENDESALARRVSLARKSAEVREKRLREGTAHLSALVSDIAHQSKTPLASVRMYADMLGDGPEALAIRSETDRLSFLFDALVKLSRCE